MKRFAIAVTLILVLLLSSGCYTVNAVKLKDVVGTYKITSYTSDGTDLIAKKGMEAYLVINSSGKSYYVYRDAKTELYVREIQLRLVQDTENPSKYAYVEYKLDHRSDYEKLAINKEILNAHSFHYDWRNGSLYQYQDYITFEKVNRATDLSYVKKCLGSLPNVLEYGYGLYDGVYSYQYASLTESWFDEPFVYLFIDLKVAASTADVYYMLKSDEIERVETNLPVTINKGFETTVTIGEKQMRLETYLSGVSNEASMHISGVVTHEENEYSVSYVLTVHRREGFDIEYQKQDRIDWYNSQKQ
jgi:hypothetical protein